MQGTSDEAWKKGGPPDADWQASLRRQSSPQISCAPSTKPTDDHMEGITALDLSYNHFTDVLAQEICPVLRSGVTLNGNCHFQLWQ